MGDKAHFLSSWEENFLLKFSPMLEKQQLKASTHTSLVNCYPYKIYNIPRKFFWQFDFFSRKKKFIRFLLQFFTLYTFYDHTRTQS